jgi:hypothetical protein
VKRQISQAESLDRPLQARLPFNTELTLAHIGDDLAIVALCMMVGGKVVTRWAKRAPLARGGQ